MAEFQNWNLGGQFQQGYERGQAIKRQDQFRALAGQAINAPSQEREFLVQQAIANDPESGFALQKQLDSDTDRRQKALFNMARGFKQIHSQNPTAAMAYFQRQIAPGLGKIGFDVDPNTPENDVVNVVDQVLATYGGGESNLGDRYRVVGGTLVDLQDPTKPVYTAPAAPRYFEGEDAVYEATPEGLRALPVAGAAPAPTGNAFDSLMAAVPGLRVTSGARTPEQNAAAGGVPNSFHLTDQARDFSNPTPEQRAAIRQWAAANNYEVVDNYRDGHLHVEPKGRPSAGFAPKGTAARRAQEQRQAVADARDQRRLELAEEAAKRQGAPTADERKAGTLLQRLDFSLDQLNKAVGESEAAASPTVLAETARALPFVGNVSARNLNSSERQRVESAQLDILDAALTLGTGAAYTREQLEGYRSSYFPEIGDSEDNVRDKAARLQNIVTAARIAAGRAAPAETGPAASAPTAPPQPKGVPRPKTQAEFDRLPSGAVFIDPDDGKTYRKP